jgi:hypothetical protein
MTPVAEAVTNRPQARIVASLLTVLVGALSPALPGVAAGPAVLRAQESAPALRPDLALRPGYHGSWGEGRDGIRREVHDLRLRAQLGATWTPAPGWLLRGRVAGRLSTEQETFRFYLRDHVPTTDGLRLGEFTVDEAYLGWRSGDRLQLRVGRMQTSFELAGVPRKALDRNDSPNTDVSWTDGVHASATLLDGWRQHLIVQRNGSRGPTNAVRRPLDVTGPGSPVTLFTAAQFPSRRGIFIQREIGLTYIPEASPVAGGGEARDDYVALVARAAVQPAQVLGGRVVLGAELGTASGAPAREALGTGTAADGRGSGVALQLSANLMEFRRRHSIGVVYAQAGDGWLISPDIRENNREVEARYFWQYARWGRLDVRYRDRRDIRVPLNAVQGRHDRDVYFRTTLRF